MPIATDCLPHQVEEAAATARAERERQEEVRRMACTDCVPHQRDCVPHPRDCVPHQHACVPHQERRAASLARYAGARAWAAQHADPAVQPAALRDAEEEAKAAARRAEHEAEVVRHEHFRREVWLRELLAREDSLRRENAKYV